jgi:SMP-30/Gluconolactonase/LRE-like region
MSEVEHILAVKNKLGEGPVWSPHEQALYWVDIENNRFYRFYPAIGKYEFFDVGVPVGVLALRASGGLVMATKNGFAFWDPQTQQLHFIGDPEADKPHNLCWLRGTSVQKKGTLRAIYWSYSACRRDAAKIESESMHEFYTLIPFSSQRRSLCSLFSSLSGNE